MHLRDPQVRTAEAASPSPAAAGRAGTSAEIAAAADPLGASAVGTATEAGRQVAPEAPPASPEATPAAPQAPQEVQTPAPADEQERRSRLGALVDAALERRWTTAFVVISLAAAVWLRFDTRSALWLDEALTVNIARAPLSEIPRLLRDDGAPPLYYVLLHFWIRLFGQGDLATRSLSGVLGVINLPVAWIAGFRMGSRWWTLDEASPEEHADRVRRGRIVGWAAMLLLASSPFAVYYDTETRMYGLVLLLGTIGVVVYTSLLRRPSALGALALAADTAALLYSHYWALYVGAVAGIGTLVWAVKAPSERTRRACRYALAGLAVGAISFIPWLPTFFFQLDHTGTPWASPAGLTAVIYTITQFAGGNSDPGRALALIFFFLAVVAVAGAPEGRHTVTLDLRSRPGVRAPALAVVTTLVLALMIGKAVGSTFADRYTAVVAFPALLVVAYGVALLPSWRVRNGVLAAAVTLGFLAAVPNAFLSRTQGGAVGSTISALGHPGDVVAFCPDQLGPAVSRTLHGDFQALTFPRGTGPDVVDWVDYTRAVEAARTGPFVRRLLRLAGKHHDIWYVWAPGYVGYGSKCQAIADALSLARNQKVVVAQRGADTPYEIFEGESLDRYTPKS
jgi:mannosyltransferase